MIKHPVEQNLINVAKNPLILFMIDLVYYFLCAMILQLVFRGQFSNMKFKGIFCTVKNY